MKFKLYVSVLMIIISTMFSLTAFASNSPQNEFNAPSIEVWGNKSNKSDFNDEQKAEMKAKHEAMKIKWESLSQAQKEEIYNLKNKVFDAEMQIIDKYVEFGIIDSDTAAHKKAKISDYKSKMQKNGEMPGFGHKRK